MADMVALFLAAVLMFSAGPARADLSGSEVLFNEGFELPSLAVPEDAKPGEPIWESGPSQPVAEAFAGLLFQGQAEDRRLGLQASIQGPDGWGPWQSAQVRYFPNGRFWGRIPLSGPAGAVLRLRLLHLGCAPGRRVEVFSLELESMTRGEPRSGPIKPAAGFALDAPYAPPPGVPEVIARTEWKAVDPKSPYEEMSPQFITVHHTQGAQPRGREASAIEMRIIQSFHQKGRHWDDIAYHFVIDGAGRVFAGRPLTALGAHVLEHNEGNVGIAIMGNFNRKNRHPTPEQLRALTELSAYLGRAFAIEPEMLFGHKDLAKGSLCPGRSLYPHLRDVRRGMKAPVAAPAPVLSAWLELPAAGLRFE